MDAIPIDHPPTLNPLTTSMEPNVKRPHSPDPEMQVNKEPKFTHLYGNYSTATAKENIKELGEIDNQIIQLLEIASASMSTLSTEKPSEGEDYLFEEAFEFDMLLQGVRGRLLEQLKKLDENIVPVPRDDVYGDVGDVPKEGLQCDEEYEDTYQEDIDDAVSYTESLPCVEDGEACEDEDQDEINGVLHTESSSWDEDGEGSE